MKLILVLMISMNLMAGGFFNSVGNFFDDTTNLLSDTLRTESVIDNNSSEETGFFGSINKLVDSTTDFIVPDAIQTKVIDPNALKVSEVWLSCYALEEDVWLDNLVRGTNYKIHPIHPLLFAKEDCNVTKKQLDGFYDIEEQAIIAKQFEYIKTPQYKIDLAEAKAKAKEEEESTKVRNAIISVGAGILSYIVFHNGTSVAVNGANIKMYQTALMATFSGIAVGGIAYTLLEEQSELGLSRNQPYRIKDFED